MIRARLVVTDRRRRLIVMVMVMMMIQRPRQIIRRMADDWLMFVFQKHFSAKRREKCNILKSHSK